MLQEGGEEEEELHPGQTLSEANPATCRKWNEGISLDKLFLFVQEVSRKKAVWSLPLIWIMQDRCQERKHCGSLLDKVTLKSDVSGGFMRKCSGEDAAQSLCLMDDGVSEGQVFPVSNLHLSVSYDPPQLLLDLILDLWILGHKQKSPSQCS